MWRNLHSLLQKMQLSMGSSPSQMLGFGDLVWADFKSSRNRLNFCGDPSITVAKRPIGSLIALFRQRSDNQIRHKLSSIHVLNNPTYTLVTVLSPKTAAIRFQVSHAEDSRVPVKLQERHKK